MNNPFKCSFTFRRHCKHIVLRNEELCLHLRIAVAIFFQKVSQYPQGIYVTGASADMVGFVRISLFLDD